MVKSTNILRFVVASVLALGYCCIASANSFERKSIYDSEYLAIDRYIPKSLSSHCTAVILSDIKTHFDPMAHRPVMLLTPEHSGVFLQDSCNIIVIPSLTSIQDMLSKFLLGNWENVVAVMAYSTRSHPITIKQVRTFARKLDVVLIDLVQNTSKLYKYPIDCHGNLKCIMKNRFLRVGYTQVPGMLVMKHVNWDDRKARNISIEPFEVNHTNRVRKYFHGVEAELLDLLVDRYQMRLQLKAPSDFMYGTDKFHTGSYNGKYGMLQRGEVDMVVGLVTTSSERSHLGSYSPPIFVTQFSLCSLRDQTVQNWDAAIRPFPKLAWGILGLSILLVAPVSWFVTKKHRELMKITHLKNDSLGLYFAHATATLLVEPWPRPPGGPAAMILGAWFIVCLILQSIYASNFAASLSFPETNVPLRTLKDVWDKKRRIMVTPGATVDWYLSKSNDSMIQKLYRSRYIINGSQVDDLFLHLDMGIVSTINIGIFYSELSKAGLDAEKYYVSDIPLLTSFGSWLFEANDVLMADEIGKVILRVSAAGLLKKWEADVTQKLLRKVQMRRSAYAESIHLALSQREMALSLGHLEGVFKFWITGTLLAILTFTYELTSRPIYNVCTGAHKKSKIRENLANYRFLD